MGNQRHASLAGVIAAFFVAVGLIVYGGYGLWQWWQSTHNPQPAMPAEIVSVSTDTPDETPPVDSCDALGSSGSQPQKIRIDAIGVDGCVQRVGVDQHKAIAVPTNIHFAGWYINSPTPGEEGVSLIDGHVLGRYNDAIFARLGESKPGDVVEITRADDAVRQFKIVDIRTFTVEEANRHLFEKIEATDSQLNLITCTGTYSSTANTYDKRIIVRAALIHP